jgi:hypothetical protein
MLGMLHVSGNFKAYFSNTTPSAALTPTTATFDKKAGEQADIPVTMTLNGNSFVSVKNGATTLTSGTQYTVSGNTVTLKKEYLAAQPNGTTTLTFTFSPGKSRNIAITVKDTTSGASGGLLLKYDFATDAVPGGYPKYGGTGTLTAERTLPTSGGVLTVTKTNTNYTTPKFILPFNVGTGNLSNYSGIKINIRGVSGDYGNKPYSAEVGSTSLGNIGNAGLSTTFKDITVPISGSNTGEVEIGFAMPGNGFVYEIKTIELVPK